LKLKKLLNWQNEFNINFCKKDSFKDIKWDILPMGHKIEKPKILFPRLK